MIETKTPAHDGWHERLFYIFFIGRLDRDKKELGRGLFNRVLLRLTRALKSSLGAYTTVRSLEAKGDTLQWGAEPTRLILVIADSAQEKWVDSRVAELGTVAARDLRQDEIWITKHRLNLFAARPSED